MKLIQWMEREGIKQTLLVKKLSLSQGRLSHYMTGRRRWPLDVAIEVEDLTKGKVSVRDLAKTTKKDSDT